jgi:hypothetical protein
VSSSISSSTNNFIFFCHHPIFRKDFEHNSDNLDGLDTSFRAFLISFLSSCSSNNNDSMEIIAYFGAWGINRSCSLQCSTNYVGTIRSFIGTNAINSLCLSLLVLAQGRNWVLLYRFPHVFYSDMFGLLTMCAYCHLMFMFTTVQHMEAWDIVIYFI